MISKLFHLIVFLWNGVGRNSIVNNLRDDLADCLATPSKPIPHLTVRDAYLEEGLSVQLKCCLRASHNSTSASSVLTKTPLSLKRKGLSNFPNKIKAITFLQ